MRVFWLVVLCVLSINTSNAGGGWLRSAVDAPELPAPDAQNWINSEPLQLAHLKGKVVLIDFWTFDCWNCYRSFPWLKQLESDLKDEPFIVLGVHTPEFAHERVRKNVEAKVIEFGLEHPVVMDNDFGYWKAMENRYWPAFYLLDKQSRVRAVFFGETHQRDAQARAIRAVINRLLSEG